MIDSAPAMESSGIEAGYGDAKILNGISLKVPKSSIVTIMGPNGSGKSTFLKTSFGLVRAMAGRTLIRDRNDEVVDITGLKPYQLPPLGMSYVPQTANVFGDMTVLENLKLGATPLKGGPAVFRDRLDEVLSFFPVVKSRLSSRAGTLSGGQRQMLAMARALITDPILLLLDEPSAGVQPDLVDAIFAKIREFSRRGLSVLIVEQKARQTLKIVDRAYLMETGRIVTSGAASDLIDNGVVAATFLGGTSGTTSLE